jgi:hypothetical protein
MRDLEEKARQAKEKKATLGPDIDLGTFKSDLVPHDYLEDLSALSESDKKQMIQAGVDAEERERAGTFVQKDTSVLHSRSKQEGLEVIPIKEALKYDWIQDYYWKPTSTRPGPTLTCTTAMS